MGGLVVASFSISRVLYLLDVYYTRWEVGCQVKFPTKREAYIVLRISYFAGEGTKGKKAQQEKSTRAQRKDGESDRTDNRQRGVNVRSNTG